MSNKAPTSDLVVITPELKSFCSALVDIYESYGNTGKDACVDWWHGFGKDIDVNLCIEDGRLMVHAYRYNEDLDTRSGVTVVNRRLRRRKS